VREMFKISVSSESLVLDDKAGKAVLEPGSAGGTRLPGSTPVEIDLSEPVVSR